VEGVCVLDLRPQEAGEVQPALRQAGLRLITLLAPTTTPERMARLRAGGEGYLYFVSMTGVTGVQQVDVRAIEEQVRALRKGSPVPVAVGFGITTPEDAGAVAQFADAVVVGSALVKIIAECGDAPELLPRVKAFIRSLREGMDRTKAG